MSATIPMKVKQYLKSLMESGKLPPIELIRIAKRDEHSYMCRVKNVETGEIFPISIHVRGFMVAQHPLDPQQLAELDVEEQWQSYTDLDVNAVPKRPNRNPFIGKEMIRLKQTDGQNGEDGITTASSPNTIQGYILIKGDYIVYRIGEPAPVNPDAPAQPVHEKSKSSIPILGYIGKVISFTDTKIIVWCSRENARYYVRPSDVVRIGKKKEQVKS